MYFLRVFFVFCIFFVVLPANAAPRDSCVVETASRRVINAREQGAIGNGVTDDTKALQRAIDLASVVGGVTFIPNGVYLIDAVLGLQLRSDMVLELADNAIIKAKPNDRGIFSMLKLESVSNVAVIGGVLQGERYRHMGSSGEWGMGISLVAVKNVVINNIISKYNWGDGFYISGKSRNISICSVIADANRRQGISIVSGENIKIVDSSFINTSGTAPQAGIDIEPNLNQMVRNVQIINSRFLNNGGPGIGSYVLPNELGTFVSDIVVRGNIIGGNDGYGISLSNSSRIKILDNTLIGNRGNAIFLDGETRSVLVTGNQIVRGGKFRNNPIIDEGVNSIYRNYSD